MTFLLILFALLSVPHASADPFIVNGVDTAPLLEFIHKHVNTVTTPFKIFHYFSGWGPYLETFPSDDPRGFAYVKYNAPQFLKHLEKTHPNIYGAGLYAATEPVTGRSFGAPHFQLVELQIPAGFRFVRLRDRNDDPLTPEVQAVLAGLNCPNDHRDTFHHLFSYLLYYNNSFEMIFSYLFYDLSLSDCANNMRQVLQHAQIDGFTYDWRSASIRRCNTEKDDPIDKSAFVIMSDRWLKPELVRIFNSRTTDNKTERLSLASMINPEGMGMLWPDLKDEKPDPNLQSWIKENLFGCGDQRQYSTP